MHETDNEMTDPEVAHLAGYFDARGVITVHVLANDDYKIGYEIRPSVKVTAPAVDQALIGKWMAYCDDRQVKYGLTEKDDSVRLDIRHLPSAKRFLDPLAPYFVASFDAVDIFMQEVLPRLMDDVHHEKQGFIEVLEAAQPLRAHPSSQERHTVEEFKQKWADELTA